jgi:hypothetical protein
MTKTEILSFDHWDLVIGIYLGFVFWNLGFQKRGVLWHLNPKYCPSFATGVLMQGLTLQESPDFSIRPTRG